MNRLRVNLGKLTLETPLIMASGTFGYGVDIPEIFDMKKIGAVITKTITLNPRPGNPQIRIWETPSGLINSIGLQNPGVEKFKKDILPELEKLKCKKIVSITGNEKELGEICERLNGEKIDGIELNVSCPNIGLKKMVSQDSRLIYKVVDFVRRKCKFPLIVKLSPNVTDIVEIAIAAEDGGADILSMINTVKAMAVDIEKMRVIAGGLSGSAIKPIGIRCVYEVYKKVKIPIIGIGGISCGKDALEYILCGASAVGIGSAVFSNPSVIDEIYGFLKNYLETNKIENIGKIVGSLNEKEER